MDVYAPDGGMVVINVPFSPFWTASSSATKLEVFPVNQIQMGIAIPAETSSIVVEYKKPEIIGQVQGTN